MKTLKIFVLICFVILAVIGLIQGKPVVVGVGFGAATFMMEIGK